MFLLLLLVVFCDFSQFLSNPKRYNRMTLDSLNDSIALLTNYMTPEPIRNDSESWQWLFSGAFFFAIHPSLPFEKCMFWTRMFDKCAICIVSIKLIAMKSVSLNRFLDAENRNNFSNFSINWIIVNFKHLWLVEGRSHICASPSNTETRTMIPLNVSRDYPQTVIPILKRNHSNLLNRRPKYIATKWHTKSHDHFSERSQSASNWDPRHIYSRNFIFTKSILLWDVYLQKLFMVLHLIRAQFNQIKVAIF